MPRPLDVETPGRGDGAGAEGGVQWRLNGANSKPHCPTIAQRCADSIFRVSYSLEELRQYHAEHGNLVREIAARISLVALRLVWRVLP